MGLKDSSDDEVRYGVGMRPVYEKLRGVFVQVGGFMILRKTGRKCPGESDPMIEHMRQTLMEVNSELSERTPPKSLALQHRLLRLSVSELRRVMDKVWAGNSMPIRTMHDKHRLLTKKYEKAYLTFKWASVEHLGLKPLDFSHSCCACTPDHCGTS